MTKNDGWFRMYHDVLNNEKVMTLDAEDFRAWVLLVTVASVSGLEGYLPDLKAVAFRLRSDARAVVERLVEKRLIDRVSGGRDGVRYKMHDWDEWQYNSKTSTERVKRHRERSRNADETPSRARQNRPDTEQTRPEKSARARADQIEGSKSDQKSEANDDAELVQAEAEIQATDPLFDRVWTGYLEFGDARSPRGKAEKLWRSLNPMVHPQVAEGVVVWALVEGQARKTDPDRKVKYLDTWLEAGLWEQYRPSSFPQFAPTAQRIVARWLDGPGAP